MNGQIRPRWWHWLLGVIMPAFTIGFEAQTHQISGTMFDPMPTPWHAILLSGLPAGCAWLLLSARTGESEPSMAGFLIAACLPYYLLLVIAVGSLHWIALFKLAFGLVSVVAEPSNWKSTLFGDYIVSPIAGAACFGPLAGFTMGAWVLWRWFHAEVISRGMSITLFTSTLMGALVIAIVESGANRARIQILNAAAELRATGRLEERAALLNSASRATIARLSHPGQQFSSAGALYAVGPVDVFGPWSYVRSGHTHPADRWMHWRVDDFVKLHKFLWPDEPIHPSSWRGLSPWEHH